MVPRTTHGSRPFLLPLGSIPCAAFRPHRSERSQPEVLGSFFGPLTYERVILLSLRLRISRGISLVTGDADGQHCARTTAVLYAVLRSVQRRLPLSRGKGAMSRSSRKQKPVARLSKISSKLSVKNPYPYSHLLETTVPLRYMWPHCFSHCFLLFFFDSQKQLFLMFF